MELAIAALQNVRAHLVQQGLSPYTLSAVESDLLRYLCEVDFLIAPMVPRIEEFAEEEGVVIAAYNEQDGVVAGLERSELERVAYALCEEFEIQAAHDDLMRSTDDDTDEPDFSDFDDE